MKPTIVLLGRTGFVEHVCKDSTCQCQTDEQLLKMRGKWIGELRMVDVNTKEDVNKPLLIGPFETEALAEIGLKHAVEEGKEVLGKLGFKLENYSENNNANLH